MTSLGAPPFVLYMLESAVGRPPLDRARVLLRIGTAANNKVRREVVLVGYSQGAHTMLSAAELWKSYAPEIPARGFAAKAPPNGFLEHAARPHPRERGGRREPSLFADGARKYVDGLRARFGN